MRVTNFFLGILLLCFVLVGCSDEGTSQDNNLDTSEPVTLSPQEQEEKDLIGNMPYIDIDYKVFIHSLDTNEDFEIVSTDEHMTTLSTTLNGMDIEVNSRENTKKVSSIFFLIEPAILENDVASHIASCLKNSFEILGFTYTEDIVKSFMDSYIESIKETYKSGIVSSIILHENENEGFGVKSDFLSQICTIEIRPFGLY